MYEPNFPRVKRLLFVIPEYSHGGTNKSLENLLHFIDQEKYEVSIFSLYEDGGDYYKKIFAPYRLKKSITYHIVHDNKVTRKVMGFLMKISSNFSFKWLYRKESQRLQRLRDFDAVIAFQEGVATEFVANLPETVNKIAWVHCDYFAAELNEQISKEEQLYSQFDSIVCVTHKAKEGFIKIFAPLYDKVYCVYNTLNDKQIFRQSTETISDFNDNHSFCIISLGRFVEDKQYQEIPHIVSKIAKLTSKPFCWYIMGAGGNMKHETEKMINFYKVNEYVKILSPKDNPYPYIKKSNLHVCTSRSESFSYTIAEAKVLHVPVLSNDFPVAYEVVDENVGWICNINEMHEVIADIINNKNNIYSKKLDAIEHYEYDNSMIMESFYKLLDNK